MGGRADRSARRGTERAERRHGCHCQTRQHLCAEIPRVASLLLQPNADQKNAADSRSINRGAINETDSAALPEPCSGLAR